MKRILSCFAYPLALTTKGCPKLVCSAMLLLLCTPSGWGGILYTFEPPTYTGSGAGVLLSGQDGWYTPNGLGNASVHTYSGTGAPTPPGGGTQFIALFGPNVQDNHIVSFASSSVWTITFDIFVHSLGTQTSAGSFFMYTNGTGYQLHAYAADGGGGTWNADFDVFDSTGGRKNAQDPGAGFDGLQLDHWYQEQIVFNTALNQILSVSIGDPGNPAATATYDPAGWYLYGGASAPFSAGGIGVFAYGTLAFDNISLDPVPEPASWALWLPGAAVLCCLRARRR